MTDSDFRAKFTLLKRLGGLALAGIPLLCVAIVLNGFRFQPFGVLATLGALCLVPGIFYLVIFVLWHWKGRYRGDHSNLWGAVLLLETTGWGKLIYLFRHIIPDARKSGRYAASTEGGGA